MNSFVEKFMMLVSSYLDFISSILNFIPSIIREVFYFVICIFREIPTLFLYYFYTFLVILLFVLSIVPPIKPFLIYVWLFGISLGIVYILCLGIIKTISILFKKILPIAFIQKNTKKNIRLVSLGITTFFFAFSASRFINAFLVFSIRFISKIIDTFIRDGNSINYECEIRFLTLEQISRYSESIYSNLWMKYIDYISEFLNNDCLSNLFLKIIQNWNSSFVAAYNDSKIYNLPFLNIIYFISVWYFIYKLITLGLPNNSSLRLNKQKIKENFVTQSKKIFLFLKNLKFIIQEPVRSNILFFIILGVGLYLSIATIAAIPTLQDTTQIPEELSSENFKKQIDSSLETFKTNFPIEEDNNPFDKIRNKNPLELAQKNVVDKIEEIDNNYNENIQKINIDIAEIQNKIEKVRKQYETEINNLNEKSYQDKIDYDYEIDIIQQDYNNNNNRLYQQLNSKEKQRNIESNKRNNSKSIKPELDKLFNDRIEIIDNAIKMYASSHFGIQKSSRDAINQYLYSRTVRKGNRETQEHFIDLNDWFGSVKNQFEIQIDSCQDSIKNFDNDLESLGESKLDYIINYAIEERTYEFETTFDNLIDPFKESVIEISNSCTSLNTKQLPEIPSRPNLGNYLGLFSIVASWLLKTESLPLTLITGLLGFGLLGSACSSFVREYISSESHIKNKEIQNSPLVKNLSKVIIIGLSAAILVFLAVMGGLAVFFSTNSNPNPYALLLGCLISAVFGEDIWKTARRRLKENLDNSNSSETEISASVECEVVTKENNFKKKRKKRKRRN